MLRKAFILALVIPMCLVMVAPVCLGLFVAGPVNQDDSFKFEIYGNSPLITVRGVDSASNPWVAGNSRATLGDDGTLDIKFVVHEGKLEISGAGKFAPGQKVRTDLTELSRMILHTVVDSASLQQADGTPVFELVKSKA